MGLGASYRFEDSGNARSIRKRRRAAGELRNTCPHVLDIDSGRDENGNPALHVQYAFETYVGTLSFFCMNCGIEVSQHATNIYREQLERDLVTDPSGTMERLAQHRKKTIKLAHKLNRFGRPPTRG